MKTITALWQVLALVAAISLACTNARAEETHAKPVDPAPGEWWMIIGKGNQPSYHRAPERGRALYSASLEKVELVCSPVGSPSADYEDRKAFYGQTPVILEIDGHVEVSQSYTINRNAAKYASRYYRTKEDCQKKLDADNAAEAEMEAKKNEAARREQEMIRKYR
jgi:hypothetical protein